MKKENLKTILTTINAKYYHSSFGLRYLLANLNEFEKDTKLIEYSLDSSIEEIVENLIVQTPDIIGFGCYIWNIKQTLEVCQLIQSVKPDIKIILGGPEVSYEYDEFLPYCDYIMTGEGEFEFYNLIKKINNNENIPNRVIHAKPICDLNEIKTPYHLYSDEDIAHRMIYVEASRGCPFSCEFCLSSLSKGVREFDIDNFLTSMDMLVKKGVKHFKFIDRTFNIKYDRVKKILDFFKERWVDGMMLHFEIFPDRVSDLMMEEIKNFPKNGLHLEAGVQTFYEPSLKAISRSQNEEKTLKNLEFITTQTGALIHSDLVVGLPYSSIKTFETDFEKIMLSNPQELQIGILKRLRGAPIDRHTKSCEMIYAKTQPYEIMQTKDIDYLEMQTLKRFARYFDIFYNSGKFHHTMKILFNTKENRYQSFATFSKHVWENYHKTYKISLNRQTKILFDYLKNSVNEIELARTIFQDYSETNRNDGIEYIKDIIRSTGEKVR